MISTCRGMLSRLCSIMRRFRSSSSFCFFCERKMFVEVEPLFVHELCLGVSTVCTFSWSSVLELGCTAFA